MKKPAARRPPQSSALTVADAMTPVPVTIGKKASLAVAHRTMNENHVRHLPVVEGGRLVGVISQRDLYFLESIVGVDVDADVVEDAMTTDIYSVPSATSLAGVVRTMARKRYGCALVVDKAKVVGIFTTTDALRILAGLMTPPHRPREQAARPS